ncbi:MAG: threonine--tRNA ligase, partial [Actinobacteria bacterium]|nr:threonine--tRNA ligase [Actinomycetota bacterium]
HAQLTEGGVRAELDTRTESIGRKIRDAELRKIPYMLVVGDREAADGTVAVREHHRGDVGSMAIGDLATRIAVQSRTRSD